MSKHEKKTCLVATRLTDSAAKKLREEAARQGRTQSDVIRRLVEKRLGCAAEECPED